MSTYEQLIATLKEDAGDYGVAEQGIPTSQELDWGPMNQHAWMAANAIEVLEARVKELEACERGPIARDDEHFGLETQGIVMFAGEYRFLSNFWRAEVTFDGVKYPTVEHAYQAVKSRDADARDLIASSPTPGGAKRAGQELTVRDDWETIKVPVMAGLVAEKCATHPELATLLLNTDGMPIVEGNSWHDTFWGCCSCEEHDGAGENHLGTILMSVRAALIHQRRQG